MFWALWVFDAVLAAIPVYFFLAGLEDGSVSSFNITLWLALLLIIAGVLVGSALCRSHGNAVAAWLILAVLAVPGALGTLYFLGLIVLNPRWN
ncbi:MAG TPA: hypothetical protein PLR60_11285 [Syntrophorhabdaceae bacterium]|nr:hypothetical protein [Syntrophorhabdaceae bacterium]